MLTHRKSRGIAIVAVLISAVVFLGIIIAITGTLSLSSRQSTGDQRVTLEAQYASESGLSRVMAEAQTGLLNRWSNLFYRIATDTNATPTTIEALARQFCNYDPATAMQTIGYSFCSVNPAASAVGSTQYDIFVQTLDAAAYTAAGVTPPASLTAERNYWVNAFSDGDVTTPYGDFRYDQSLGGGVRYLVSFGLMPLGVNLVSGRYRFEFAVRDSNAVGLYEANSTVISRRTSTRSYPDRYFIELEPPSFARYLLVTNSQTQLDQGGSGNNVPVYFTTNTLMDGPVFTNGVFNFRGRPWFSDSVRSAGCVTGTPTANQICNNPTTNYNDGDPTNPANLVSITSTGSSGAPFTGYSGANASANASAIAAGNPVPFTAPEFIRDQPRSNGTYVPDAAPNPWRYTGEYNRPAIELPRAATDQQSRGRNGGIAIEPSASPALGEFASSLGGSALPTRIEMFATDTGRSASTNFAPVDPRATAPNPVYQLIRVQALQRISRCRAVATSVSINPTTDTIRLLATSQNFVATVNGQAGFTYLNAPTSPNVIFSRAETPAQTGVVGNISNTTAPGGISTTFQSTSGVTTVSPTPAPIVIRATPTSGGAVGDVTVTVRDAVPAITVSTNSTSLAYPNPASALSRTFNWVPSGSGPLTITLTRTATNGGAAFTTQTFTGAAATIARTFTDSNIAVGTSPTVNTVYTYRWTITNSAGEAGTVITRTVTILAAVAPSIELYTDQSNWPYGSGTFRLLWRPYSGNVPTGPLTYTISNEPRSAAMIAAGVPSFTQNVSGTPGTTGISVPYTLAPNSTLDVRFNLRVTGPGTPNPSDTSPTLGGDWENYYVAGLAPPVITDFSKTVASPSGNLPYSGGVARLNWNVTGVNTTVTITPNVSPSTVATTAGGTTNTTGSINANSTNVTRTYTLTASNAAGSVNAQTTVEVDPLQPPSITSFASNAPNNTVTAGTATTLNWTIASDEPLLAVTVQRVLPTTGTLNTQATSLTGSRTGEVISTDATYTLTARNTAGTTTRNLRMLVSPPDPPVLTLSATPAAGGGSVKTTDLTYSVSSAVGFTFALSRDPSYNGGPSLPSGSSASSISNTTVSNVRLIQSTWYTLTATNAGGTSSIRVLVPFAGGGGAAPPLPTVALVATPATLPVGGGTSTLSWTTTADVTSWTLRRISPSPVVVLTPGITGDGSRQVSVTRTTTYEMTVSNATGSATSTATVTVPDPPLPVINSYDITPAAIPFPSGNATHTWSTSNADTVSIDRGVGVVTGSNLSVFTNTSPASYVMTASNAVGSVQKVATVVIAPQVAPAITGFTASNSSLPYLGGSGTSLDWTTNVVGAGAVTYTLALIAAPAGVPTGSVGVTGPNAGTSRTPTVSGNYTYRITASNAVGNSSRDVTVNVAQSTLDLTPPVASPASFGYQGTSIAPSSLSWTATGTPAPAVTISRITAPAGAPNFSPNIIGGVGSNQTQAVSVRESGTYTYRITATSPDTSRVPVSVSRDVSIIVGNPVNPAIGTFTATPQFLNSPGTVGYTNGNATLAWTGITGTAPIALSINNGVGVVTGASNAPVSHNTVGTYTYTLTATGPSGTTAATRPVSVTVRPAETLVSLGGTSTSPPPSLYMPRTGTAVIDPNWQVTPLWTTTNLGGIPVVTAANYQRSVSPAGEAVTLPTVDAAGNVGYTVGQLPSGIDQRDYTITVTATVNTVIRTKTFTVTVVRPAAGSSLRPRATLTQTTPASCSPGNAMEYLWPVFREYHIEQTGGTRVAPIMTIYERTYGAGGEIADPTSGANWSNRPATAGGWSAGRIFNGTIYVEGQSVLSGPSRIGVAGDVNNPIRIPPAVAKFAGLTLASSTGMTITSDLTYQSPVCSTPPSRLNPTSNVTPATCVTDENLWERNALGLFAPTGDINIQTTLNNPTLQAITMASSGRIQVSGVTPQPGNVACPGNLLPANNLGSVNIQGGLIQNTYGLFGREQTAGISCGYGRTMTYDRRMRNPDFNPPGFPTASNEVWTTRVYANGVQVTPSGNSLPLRPGFSRIK